MEAIGVLEELLKIKKANFGTNSREVTIKCVFILIVHEIMQTAMWNMQHTSSLLSEERGCQQCIGLAEEVRRTMWK